MRNLHEEIPLVLLLDDLIQTFGVHSAQATAAHRSIDRNIAIMHCKTRSKS